MIRSSSLLISAFAILASTQAACAVGELEEDVNNIVIVNNNNTTPDMGGDDDSGTTNGNNDGPFDGQEPMTIVREGTRGFLLHGLVLTATGLLEDSQVLTIGNDIVCVDTDCTGDDDAANATWIATGGVISPGLVDAHNHLAYNFLPEWVAPAGMFYENRYQWSDDPTYEAHIAPYAAHRTTGTHACPATKWGELRSLVNGTTTMQGQSPNQNCMKGGIRNADHEHRLQYDHMRTMIGSPRDVDDDAAQSFFDSLDEQSEPTTRIAIHMQEGYANNNVLTEFDSWAGRDERTNRHAGQSLLHKESSVLIHSMSLTPAQLDEVAATNSKVVWSPSSNMVLYNQTAPIQEILNRGILTAIGPDWTLSGEDNMLGELRYARDYAIQNGVAELTPQRLWEMATSDGAEVVGLDGHIGKIEVGYKADLVVFARVESNPYLAVLQNRPQDIGLVMINGQPYYGEGAHREAIARNVGCEPFDACGVAKFICAKDPDYDDGTEGVGDIAQRLIDILEGTGYPADEQYGRGDELLPLVDCN